MAEEETQSGDRADRGEQGGESWEQKYSDVRAKLDEVSTQLKATREQSQQTAEKLQQRTEQLAQLQAQQQTLTEKLETLSRQSPANPTGNESKPGNDVKPNESSERKPGTTAGSTPSETKPAQGKPAAPPAKPQHKRRSI